MRPYHPGERTAHPRYLAGLFDVVVRKQLEHQRLALLLVDTTAIAEILRRMANIGRDGVLVEVIANVPAVLASDRPRAPRLPRQPACARFAASSLRDRPGNPGRHVARKYLGCSSLFALARSQYRCVNDDKKPEGEAPQQRRQAEPTQRSGRVEQGAEHACQRRTGE